MKIKIYYFPHTVHNVQVKNPHVKGLSISRLAPSKTQFNALRMGTRVPHIPLTSTTVFVKDSFKKKKNYVLLLVQLRNKSTLKTDLTAAKGKCLALINQGSWRLAYNETFTSSVQVVTS